MSRDDFTLPYPRDRVAHKHARRRRLKRRIIRAAIFVVAIIAATYVFDVVFNIGKHIPNIYEPKDLEREQQLKKELDGKKP